MTRQRACLAAVTALCALALSGVVTRAQAANNTFVDYLTATVASDGFRYAGTAP